MYGLMLAFLTATLLVVANAQIPTICADQSSLENLTCCPNTEYGVCGEDINRGFCATLDYDFDNATTAARINWPHYYTKMCQCSGNFGGFDCSRCEFGYYGPNCSQFQVEGRKPARDLSDEDWNELTDIILATRTTPSGYSVVLVESLPGTWPLEIVPVTIYEYFVWSHHYGAKDAGNPNPAGRYVYLVSYALYLC